MASMKAPGILLILSCVLLACSRTTTGPIESKPAPETPPDTSSVTGEVLVGFREGVSEQEADAMFVAHGLRWESYFSKLFAYWVEVESGDPNDQLARVSHSSIVLWAKLRGNPYGVPHATYILVMFNVTATNESAQAWIDSIPGLHVSSKVFPTQVGRAHVPLGKEQEWIEVLEKEPIVKFASLNHIFGPA